ncbi:hypothetical protein ACWC98_35705 [Streptomyces goshikiensis]
MALEAARPHWAVAVGVVAVSAMRSRLLAMSRTPADQPSSKRCSAPCGALLPEMVRISIFGCGGYFVKHTMAGDRWLAHA